MSRDRAERYAVGVRGVLLPLVAGERRHDAEPAPPPAAQADDPMREPPSAA